MTILLPLLLAAFVVLFVIFWKKMNLLTRVMCISCLVSSTLFVYPLWSFNGYREKIDVAFEAGDCPKAIKTASVGLEENYGKFSNILIANSTGFTPRFFFLSIIGICEYRQEKYEKSILTLTQALEYANSNSYDVVHIGKTQGLLEKASQKIAGERSDQAK